MKYWRNMTLKQFRENIAKDEDYTAYCQSVWNTLGNKTNATADQANKNAMCTLVALFTCGVSANKDNWFLNKIQAFEGTSNQYTSWGSAINTFLYSSQKNQMNQLSNAAKDFYSVMPLTAAVDWLFSKERDNKLTIKNPDEMKKSLDATMTLLIDDYQDPDPMIDTSDRSERLTALLESNCQMILNGAPGTGKTWTAKNTIAPLLMKNGEALPEKFRIGMVQFHPSYDYTDFIEGFRPDLNEGNNKLGYTLKNGAFKDFCCRAGVIERIAAAGKSGELLENDPQKTRKIIAAFLHVDEEPADPEEKELLEFWVNWWNDDATGIQTYISNYRDCEQKKAAKPKPPKGALPPFLFIVDEINRAEISRVLGEVMFCLDPDYRGERGKIKTQYAVSATERSFFLRERDDEFFIPSNVYIVGTMNDIDRSVEVFDFALRRRFAWYEIKAFDEAYYKQQMEESKKQEPSFDEKADDEMKRVLDNMLRSQGELVLNDGRYSDYLDRITKLNWKVRGLQESRHYCLGPSYFGKIREYYTSEQDNYFAALRKLWDNHLSQILTEYTKGKRNKEEDIAAFGEEFCRKPQTVPPEEEQADDKNENAAAPSDEA